MAPTRRPPRAKKVPSRTKKKPAGRRAQRTEARIGRPPGKASAETRAAILSAARQQFGSAGYERATNRAIGEEAGVTAAAIYQYFDSKPALYVAVVAEALSELLPSLRVAADEAPSARAALSAMIHELSTEQHLTSLRFLVSVPVEMQRHPELGPALVEDPGIFFELVLDVVKRGVREGEIAGDKAEQVIGVYIATMMGLSIHSSVVPASHADAALEGFLDLLEGTLFL